MRYTGASLTFNLAGIVGASLAPYLATYLAAALWVGLCGVLPGGCGAGDVGCAAADSRGQVRVGCAGLAASPHARPYFAGQVEHDDFGFAGLPSGSGFVASVNFNASPAVSFVSLAVTEPRATCT